MSGIDPGPSGESSATITVPPLGFTGPQLRDPVPPITTPENKSVAISIDKYLVDPSGKAMRLTSSSDLSGADGSTVADSPSQFTFTPIQGYVGPAAVTFDVTDVAPGPADTAPPRTFTLHITVTGDNAPPIFYGPVLSAVVGEHSSFNLSKYIKDTNPGGSGSVGLSFTSPPVGNLGASLSGQTLTLFPQNDEGDVAILNLNLKDSHGATAKGAVQIDVVATNRPLAVAVPQDASVDQGKSVTVDVLSADVNPYPSSEPLKVLNASSLTAAPARPRTNGTSITFTATSSFSGTATVDYTLQDESQLQSREVHGAARVPDHVGGTRATRYPVHRDRDRPVDRTFPKNPIVEIIFSEKLSNLAKSVRGRPFDNGKRSTIRQWREVGSEVDHSTMARGRAIQLRMARGRPFDNGKLPTIRQWQEV